MGQIYDKAVFHKIIKNKLNKNKKEIITLL